MDGTPVPPPEFSWTINGTPVAGGTPETATIIRSAEVVSGTSDSQINAAGAQVSQIDIAVLPGTQAGLSVMVVIGGFLLIRWLVKSIPFM